MTVRLKCSLKCLMFLALLVAEYRQQPHSDTSQLTVKPWRDIKGSWTTSFYDKLSVDIKTYRRGDVKGLLLLGPVKAEKTTFINSICSIGNGKLVKIDDSGLSWTNDNVSFTRYRGEGLLEKFCLYDIMGLKEDFDVSGFPVSDIVNLIEGHMKNTQELLSSKVHQYNLGPKTEEKIQCVIFVIDAEVIRSGPLSRGIMKNITSFKHECKLNNIPQVLILTKVDRLCDNVAGDILNLFRSTKVYKAVKKASEMFDILECNIHPVKNYEENDRMKNIPLLLALQQIIQLTSDNYVENEIRRPLF